MPTPTGKPKVGERVVVKMPKGEAHYGTVLRREDGLIWSLRVLFDGERQPRVIGEAGWMMDKGYLRLSP